MATMAPYKTPDAGEIKRRWQACTDDMLAARRSLSLNDSFFHGEQWVGWNDATHVVDTLDFTSQEDAQRRTTVNKIKPRTVQFEARCLRTPLEFEPRPEGTDAEDIRRNRIAQQVLAVDAHRKDWELVRADQMHFLMLAGVSAVSIEPDWEYKTAPVPDASTGDLIRVPDRPSPKFTAMTADEFGIEPGVRSSRDARWWIRCTTLTPEQARDHYKLDYLPTPDGQASRSAMHRMLSSRKADRTPRVCLVYVLYERPCGDCPGVVVHVIGDKVVLEHEWPFPWDHELNLRTFIQTRRAGTWKGDTFLNDCRQLQVNLNRAYTTINSHMGKADNARMVLPQGAMVDEDDELTGEVGEIIRVNPDSTPPFWMQPPQVARWLREHIASMIDELDDAFSAHAVSRGQAPGDRNSGLALSILAEKDETPLGLMAADQQRGWQWLAEAHLKLTKYMVAKASQHPDPAQRMAPQTYTDVMLAKDGAPEKVEWSAADLPEHPIVHVPLESVMPRSQSAVQQQMLTLAQTFPQMFQGLGPGELAVVLQTPDPTAFTREIDPQINLADWENSRMVVGAEDEEVEIADWHDHDIHVQRHNRLRASAAYRDASDQVREYIDLHVDAHATLAQQAMMQQIQQQMAAQQSAPVDAGAGNQPPEEPPQ